MPNETKIFSSRTNEPGLVGSTLIRTIYKDTELKKAVDVVVDELLPELPEINRNLVTLDEYNDAIAVIEDLSFINETLTLANNNFISIVNELEGDKQSLQSEIDSLNTIIPLLENQIQEGQNSLRDMMGELSSLRQQLTSTQIANAQLNAQITALEAKISALEAQIIALQVALANSGSSSNGGGGGGGGDDSSSNGGGGGGGGGDDSSSNGGGGDDPLPTITLNKRSQTVGPSVGVIMFDVLTNNENLTWELSSDVPWVTLSGVNSITKGNNSVMVNISANSSGPERVANISVSGTGVFVSADKKIYTLTQTATERDGRDPVPTGRNIFNVTNNGAGNYVINGQSNPTLDLIKGETYVFNINATGHPFWIKTNISLGTENAYNVGVTNNGIDNGTITFKVPLGAPTLYYNCQFHSTMAGTLNTLDPNPIPINPVLTVSETFITAPEQGGSKIINVINRGNGTLSWSAVSNSNWVTVSPTSQTGNNQQLQFIFDKNQTGNYREANVEITSTTGSGSPKVITIGQNSDCIQYTATAILTTFSYQYLDCNGQIKKESTLTTATFLAKKDSPKTVLGSGLFLPPSDGSTFPSTDDGNGGNQGDGGDSNPSDDTNPNDGTGNDDELQVGGNEQTGSFNGQMGSFYGGIN